MSAFKDLQCRDYQSSVDLSAPTILQPWVQIPSTKSTLFSFEIELWCEKDGHKQKEAGIGQYYKKCIAVELLIKAKVFLFRLKLLYVLI